MFVFLVLFFIITFGSASCFNYGCWIWLVEKVIIVTNEDGFFYIGTIVHLRDTQACWRKSKSCWPKLKRLVFVQWKHVLYRYKTQINPASKLCRELERLETTNTKIRQRKNILNKKELFLFSNLFYFLIFSWCKPFTKVHNKFPDKIVKIKMLTLETLKDLQ